MKRLPCKICIALPRCISLVINERKDWCRYNQKLVNEDYTFFKESVFVMLFEKCSILATYAPCEQDEFGVYHGKPLSLNKWSKRVEMFHSFFQRYYPDHHPGVFRSY